MNWLNVNTLKANLRKTKLLNFSQRILTQNNFNTNFNNQPIEEANTSKFLGLYIDNKITWKPHIKQLCKRVSRSAYILHELAYKMNTNTLITVYHGLVTSPLRYSIILWGNSTNKEL